MFSENILFKEANIGIIIADPSGGIVGINPFAESMFGYDAGELINKKIEVLLPAKLKTKHIQLRNNYMSQPTNRPMGEGRDLKAVKKNGAEFYVEVSLSFFKDDNELRVVSFINDITESKKNRDALKAYSVELERKVDDRTRDLSDALIELNHVNKDLEQQIIKRKEIEAQVRAAFEKEKELNDLKSRFVSMASHEFRTPLGGILSSTSLIKKYIDKGMIEKCDKHINTIKSSVNNLTSILNDFLSLDKLEQGLVGAEAHHFSAKVELEKIIGEIENTLADEITIDFQFQGEDKKVYQDPKILKNILLNLISNAVKYSDHSKKIVISSVFNDNLWSISVQDFGIGIPQVDQEKLFSRFHRASNVTHIQGTGLGLSIVKKYLDFISGKIEFSSVENEGTTFTITLPTELE
ncbi:MAG: PAS domain-containing sensor histidine kinase [Halobacteriovoraceae bacterium]|nr:PAS domain-containing sensor histidine kinase [Halobacteriovoraceae bacterium]|tara:strand:- start:7408 stop:8634 length:1227 start_codon:yes stop_codon:yes gene_type:complete